MEKTIIKNEYVVRSMQYVVWSRNFKFFKSLAILLATGYMLLIVPSASAGTIIKSPAYLGLTRGLVGCWNFDGAYAIVPDCSGNNNTGTITGATKVNGKVGQALDFNGSSNEVQVLGSGAVAENLPNMTVTVWAKTNADQNTRRIVSKQGNLAAPGWYIGATNAGGAGKFYFGLADSDGVHVIEKLTSPIYNDDQWHHIALVVTNTSTMNVYIDGSLVTLSDGSVPPIDDYNSSGAIIRIGGDVGSDAVFDGSVDDVRIYNRALSANEIARLYKIGLGSTANRTTTALDRGLVGCWNFDGAYNKVPDCSGNGNTGNLMGDATKRPGKVGQAVQFSGNTNHNGVGFVGNSIFDNMSPMSISFWADISDYGAGGQGMFVSKENGGGTGWRVVSHITPNALVFQVDYATQTLYVEAPNLSTTFNKWTHWVITWDGSGTAANVHIYQNGAEVSKTGPQDGTGGRVDDSVWDLEIGNSSGLGSRNIQGLIDEVKIYKRVLSANEVTRLYKAAQSKFNSSKSDVLTSGLVGHWTFDGSDISGTRAKDSSGKENHGTMTNSPRKVPGKVGQALSFNGVDNDVEIVASLIGTGAFTVASWIYPTSNNGYHTIMSADDGTVRFDCLLEATTNLLRCDNEVGGEATTATAIPLNTWTYITVARSSDDVTYNLYVNGVLNGSANQVVTPSAVATNVIVIGSRGSEYFNGSIDEVRIYNRALSAGEINKLYQMGR